ncbi:uncharacterized protein ACRADG_013264 [Cochliomyia hominivorax]
MNFWEKLEVRQCRTCYNETKGLKLLTDLTNCPGNGQMSFAELLANVSHINIMQNNHKELPQFICETCSKKLKAAQAFIQQTHKVNEQLMELLERQRKSKQKLDCLAEIPVQVEIAFDNSQEDVGFKLEPEECAEDLFNEMKKDEPCDTKEEKMGKDVLEPISSSGYIKNEEDQVIYSPDNQSHDREKNANKLRKSKKSKDSVEILNEDDDVAVACSKCDKIFDNSKALTRHLNTSHLTEDQKFACPICFRKFTQTCSMYTHMRTFHGPDSVPLIRKPLTEERTFQCSKCPKNYTKRKYLLVHMKNKHSQGNEDTTSDEIKPSTNEETANKKSPNRPLCSVCGKSFINKTHLTIHMRRHTGERPFKCDLCDRAFPRLVELTYHRRIHTGEKPFECKICGKCFRVSRKLNSHMISHTDERPYKCTECERSFKYSKDLNIHFRIHTGERPYSCNVCGSTFVQSNSLRTHRIKLGHMEEGEDNNKN